MERLPNWLRWILVLPTSIITYEIVRILNNISFRLSSYFPVNQFFIDIFNVFIEGTIATAMFLGTAYYIAPKKKITVIIMFSILIGIMCVAGSTFSLIHGGNTPLWKVLLSAILTIGTCIYTCVIIIKSTPIEHNK